ncbi:MAG: 30S ribosomal protein S7 [bacterium]|nr:30S ribosomal protein S7 [bacterium]
MPRRIRVLPKREYVDPRYNSAVIGKFINSIMKRGKKSTALYIFYDALEVLHKKTGEDGYQVFDKALANVKPIVEVRPRRIGGATYQVPMEVKPERKLALAIRWVLDAARDRSEHTMAEKLAGELLACYKKENSGSMKKREDTHRMAEANKAYAHFRF